MPWMVAAVTRPGDRVADWFVGSGTTAAVAQRTGRRFVAVDREAAAIAVCTKRLVAQGRRLAAAGTPPPALEIDGPLVGDNPWPRLRRTMAAGENSRVKART